MFEIEITMIVYRCIASRSSKRRRVVPMMLNYGISRRKGQKTGPFYAPPYSSTDIPIISHPRPSVCMAVQGTTLQTQRPLSHRRRPQTQAWLLWRHQHGDPQH